MVAKEQVWMALFLFVFGGWGVYAGIWGPHVDPRYARGDRRHFSFSRMLAATSPSAERVFSRVMTVLCGLAFIAGGIFVLVHKW